MQHKSKATTGAWLGPLAVLAGMAMQLQQPVLWPGLSYAAALVLGSVGGWLAVRRPARYFVVLCALASASLGWGLAGSLGSQRCAARLHDSLQGVDLQVSGIVAGLPQPTGAGQGTRFVFEVREADQDGRPVVLPRLLLLSWYSGSFRPGASGSPEPAPDVRAGQAWRFTVRLKQPHGLFNPHARDHELWLFEQGIGATGQVRAAGPLAPRLIGAPDGGGWQRWRQRVRDAIQAEVTDPRAAGVLAALVVGDQAAIDDEAWEVYRLTGVAHLMAISGLHVTMFAWLAAVGVGRLWRLHGPLMLRWPAPSAARVGGLALATAYALFSGWGVPAQRTVCMLAVVTLMGGAGRRWPWPLVLLWAAVVVAAFDPWALLQPGFWLSFGAVALLMAAQPGQGPVAPPSQAGSRLRRLGAGMGRAARDGVRTQVHASVGLAPLSLLFFHQVSLVGLLANLVAIPLVTLVVTPLALLGVAWLRLWHAAAAVMQALDAWLVQLAGWPFASWAVAAAPAWALAAGCLAGLLAVLPLPLCWRLLALPLGLPLLMPQAPRPAAGHFEVLAADVGQGGAVIVRTAQHTLVYDSGPPYGSDTDAGERVLLPLLQALGEGQPDRLVLSHRDSDHVGGAGSLLRAFASLEVWSSLEPAHPLRAQMARHTDCLAGQAWWWDGVHFEVLHPFAGDRSPPLAPNRVSCVLKVSGGGHSALLPGDIERSEELRLVSALGAGLQAELLLAPHHGSKTSSSAPFLDAVQPRTVVFQAGWRNRFGHPASSVVARYDSRGIERIASPSCGAYRWADGHGECEREVRRRYWHHRP